MMTTIEEQMMATFDNIAFLLLILLGQLLHRQNFALGMTEKQTILQPDDSIYLVTEDWESEIDLLERRRRLGSCVMEEISALIITSPPRPRSLLDRRGRKLPPLPLDNSKALRC
ncbi:hypothetical protein LSAT2_014583, partial [Lamellibrachia satsuma]